ncbi:MAG: hypothetical protein N5P05_002298 [Chroococcopsis gigantea SAG 12.99]|jgi:hypothetical protein|nr:hypothetical protein [Chlorogloea purpurea SAG 13.99]MDV3000692.1 hypothetical protein [Chroococcopsis gigantea SAG 12.99]
MESINRPLERADERIVERPPAVTVAEYHDRVRWGPILAGLAVALSTQLILSGIGAAIGLSSIAGSGAPRSNADDVGSAVGIWSMISLLIALFVGGWTTARSCGPMNRSTALLNGAILWATTLALSAWLLTNGVSGLFGWVANNADVIVNQVQQGSIDVPNTTTPSAQQTRDVAGNAAKVGWTFALGSLLGLISSLIGASAGARKHRNGHQYQD